MTVPQSSVARRLAALAAAAALAQLAGCATGTSATGAWQEPRTSHAPFGKILVVGLSPNSRMRRAFEQEMTDDIKETGASAVESVFVASEMNIEEPTRQNVRAMATHAGVDAVLVARLVSRTVKPGMTQETADVKFDPKVEVIQGPNSTQVYAGDYWIEELPGQEMVNSNAKIEAVLYAVADNGRPAYKVEIDEKFREENADAMVDVAADISTAITRKLREDGLLR